MAVLLKKNNPTVKGILILNHKEVNLLPYFSPFRDRYLIGCHVGCHHKSENITGFDFYLSSPEQLPDNFPDKDKIIPMNSRNFLPNEFHNIRNKTKESLLYSIEQMHKVSKVKISNSVLDDIRNNEKDYYWDILWVNKPHSVKNIKTFLDQLKILFNTNPCNVLLICAISPNEYKYKDHFLDVESYIKQIFTEEERKFISLLRPETSGNEGADNSLMPPFYQWSNAFAFYTQKEGESRVVHEALCCGCRIVYYKYVEGGSDDYLDNTNSIAFDSYAYSHESLLSAIKLNKVADCTAIHDICLCENTIDKFKKELVDLYNKHNLDYDGEMLDIPNLHFELPAHNHKVPWKEPHNETGDLTIPYLNEFIQHTGM
tara:strand:- start:359 stop:1474 length:1116 start_codon:yes stop_codon:yes gene_type:complete